MAPAAKKTKTTPAPVAPGANKAGFARLFGGGAPAEKPEVPPAGPAETEDVPTTFATEQPAADAAVAPLTTPSRFTNSELAGTPSASPSDSASPATQATPPSSVSSLSDEQRQRIEENRRKALERKRAREAESAAAPGGSPAASAPLPATAAAAAAPPEVVQNRQQQHQQPQPTPGKATSKAKAKGAAGKAKAKSKAEPSADADPATDSTGSPAKLSQGGPKAADSTPEKTAQPSQEKRSCAPALASQAAVGPEGKFERHSVEQWNQYASLYGARLSQLRGVVSQEARAMWGGRVAPSAFCSDICNYKQGSSGEVVVVGVLFKDLKTRPDIIQLYRDNRLKSSISSADDPVEPGCLCSDNDRLFIEDRTMRLGLKVSPDVVASFCSGFVAAVLGTPSADGELVVESPDFIFARLPPPPPLPRISTNTAPGAFVALVSGLARPGGEDSAHREALERLTEFVSRGVGGELRRLIVCGGSICSPSSCGASPVTKEALATADQLLARLAACTQVHVMPGKADPSNMSLPQLPLHPQLFRQACAAGGGAVWCVSNPYASSLEGFGLLGHAGQPVEDMLRSMRGRGPMDALRMCLHAMHLAPTAPDTLPTPPFEAEDPFVIRDVPHLLFSGNHERAEHEWSPAPRGAEATSGTQLVLVPAFHVRPAVVLVSTRDPRDVRIHELGIPGAAVPSAGDVDASMGEV